MKTLGGTLMRSAVLRMRRQLSDPGSFPIRRSGASVPPSLSWRLGWVGKPNGLQFYLYKSEGRKGCRQDVSLPLS